MIIESYRREEEGNQIGLNSKEPASKDKLPLLGGFDESQKVDIYWFNLVFPFGWVWLPWREENT